MSKLKRAALAYASRLGWRVFPLRPRDKTPLIAKSKGGNGVYDATTDAKIIETWWNSEPAANIGLACGHDWWALDVDPRNFGDETLGRLEAEHGKLPETPTQITGGGGSHILMALPSNVQVCGTIGEGIDLKGLGGYIVAAPSVHPSGAIYQWEGMAHPLDMPIAGTPRWLLDVFGGKTTNDMGGRLGLAEGCFLARCFDVAGWLGKTCGDGAIMAKCPWLQAHSPDSSGKRTGDGTDSSCVILPPTESRPLGSFHCSHSHCAARGNVDALLALPDKAIGLAYAQNDAEFELAKELVRKKAKGML